LQHNDQTRRILIATDAWFPQINGVVRTLENTIKELKKMGYEIEVICPSIFKNFPCPLYPEIALSFPKKSIIRNTIEIFKPDHLHIVTEGPIGLAVRKIAIKDKLSFSTSFHTRFPDYLWALAKVPPGIVWRGVKWFHSAAKSTMCPTPSIQKELIERGLKGVKVWTRGIDTSLFYPRERTFSDHERPILMYVGRVSKEKNIEDFLKLEVAGTKYVVGDGPQKEALSRKYPEAKFLGYRTGDALVETISNGDVFVFPSKTETFGNVMLEALATGMPVAAYPAPGPKDLITNPLHGCISEDLKEAVENALKHGMREECISFARSFSWRNATEQFVSGLVSI